MFKPENIPQITPYFTISGDASIAFYKNAFGFILEKEVRNEEGVIMHGAMRRDDIYIMFSQEEAYDPVKKTPVNLGITLPLNMYVYCQDVDVLYKTAISNGAKSIMEPQDSFWGGRFCVVIDHDGYEWYFATLLSKK